MTAALPPSARDLERAATASQAQLVLDVVSEQLDATTKRVMRSVFEKLKAGEELTPQFAIVAWAEMHAAERLREALLSDIRKRPAPTRILPGG